MHLDLGFREQPRGQLPEPRPELIVLNGRGLWTEEIPRLAEDLVCEQQIAPHVFGARVLVARDAGAYLPAAGGDAVGADGGAGRPAETVHHEVQLVVRVLADLLCAVRVVIVEVLVLGRGSGDNLRPGKLGELDSDAAGCGAAGVDQ